MKLQLLTLLGLATLMSAKRIFDIDKFKSSEGVAEIHKRDGNNIEQPLFQIPNPPKNDKIYIPEGEEPHSGSTLLTSSISINRDISVFASYVRDNVEISTRFNNKKQQSIVFAPTDSAIEALSLKPWQFPTVVDETKSEEEIDAIIASNTNDFILSHIVDGEVPFATLDDKEKGVQFNTENNKQIKLVNDNGDYYVSSVINGNTQNWIKIGNVINADNGVILVIPEALSSPGL